LKALPGSKMLPLSPATNKIIKRKNLSHEAVISDNMNKRTILLLIYFSLFPLFFSCDKGKVYEEIVSIPSAGWSANQAIKLDIPVNDISKAYDIMLHFRNSGNYEYSNVWMFIETKSPMGNSLRDTFEIRLADETGKWLGEGIGDVNNMFVPYKKNILFPVRGIYQVTINQAMRDTTLKHVLDFGFRLQYHK
jgi:gliding motility-associated lipoprotein GldH